MTNIVQMSKGGTKFYPQTHVQAVLGLPDYSTFAKSSDVTTAITNAISPLQTQVNNSGVGTNLLMGTYNLFSMAGNNLPNQYQQMYKLSRRLEKGTTVTLSFDAVSIAPANFNIQNDGSDGGTWASLINDTVGTTKKHYVATTTLDGFSDIGIKWGLHNAPSTTTVTISNMKLEVGSYATDYSLNPLDIATNDGVQAAIAGFQKASDVQTAITTALSKVDTSQTMNASTRTKLQNMNKEMGS